MVTNKSQTSTKLLLVPGTVPKDYIGAVLPDTGAYVQECNGSLAVTSLFIFYMMKKRYYLLSLQKMKEHCH
jgi:hypothetical protein